MALVTPLARGAWDVRVANNGGPVVEFADHLLAFADTDPENSGSIALLERLGFQYEGRLRGEWETHIGVRDSLIFGLLQGEWTLEKNR